MTAVRKTITLTARQNRWVKSQIASGDYTNDSEYIRDLIRCDQEEAAKRDALRAAVRAGLDSGASPRSVEDIWNDGERRARTAKRG